MRTLPAPDLQRKQKCVRVAGPDWLLGAMLLVVIAQLAAHGEGVPTITSIVPSSVTAGGPGFTLTVNGTGYFAGSVVQVNGAGRNTTFVSATQLTASILASDIATQGTDQITVFNPSLALPGGTSAPFQLAVTPAAGPPPVLTSAAPGLTVQGAGRLQITLQGANFRPGATVVISPNLASLANSNGHTQAGDIAVLTVNRISTTLMTATVSLSPGATVGLRAIDVLNTDGTSTATPIGPAAAGSGTTQPLQISSSASIGAPVSVLNLALLHPRDGTVVSLGGELYAEAVMSGAGTGTIIGQWLWDNRVVEQFAVNLVAGQSVTVRTHQPLPTWFLGGHTVQLRMQQPSQIATRPVTVVVNPAGWQLEELLSPVYGSAYTDSEPPALLWAPVPGAVRYQVGFSSQPYFSSISDWHNADDNHWQVPADVWGQQPEGNLYWTVRAVDSAGATRKPLPMRPILHLAQGALAPVNAVPTQSAAGHMLLDWNPANPGAFYLVTLSNDADGNRVLRRYLTDKGTLDLHAVESLLVPGQTYFWRVDVYSHWGDFLFSGPEQRFVAPRVPGPPSARMKQPTRSVNVEFVSLTTLRRHGYFDLASQIAKEAPAPNSSVGQTEPAISVQFQTPVNPADVSLAMDDVDITSLAQVTQTQVAYTPQLPLANGEHDVSLTVGNEASGWKFTVTAPTAAPATPSSTPFQPGTDAEAEPTPSPSSALGASFTHVPAPAKPASPKQKFGGEIDMQVGSTTHWASGSNPPDSNDLTLADRMISQGSPWQPAVNGSGLLDSVLNPAALRTSMGRVNDYVAQFERKGEHWGTSVRFGIVSPALYTDAQFVTAATPRQGVEATLTTPGGKLGFYTNTNDEALGGGAGITFHQRLMGASWQAPFPKWAEFRLMWLSARDIGAPTIVEYDSEGNPIVVPNPVAQASRGDVYGGLLTFHLPKKWQWQSEYAWSYDDANLSDPTVKTLFGRAWRTGLSGQAGKAALSVDFRDLSPNFGSPANPSLTQSSNPDLRGVDASANAPTKAGTFAVTYSFLQNNVQSATAVELDLNSATETWSKPLDAKTNLSVSSTQSITKTGNVPPALQSLPPSQNGSADQRDVSGNIKVSRQVGMVSLNVGGTRDWLRNNIQPSAGAITSSISAGANLVTKGFFQCNTQANISWVAADPVAIGDTRNISAYVEPAMVWKRPGLQISPLVSVVQAQSQLASGTFTSNTLSGQYGGRLAWTLPGWLKTSTLSAQGSYNQNHDNVNHTDTASTQLVGIWTFAWGHKKTF
ncbi:MAG: IPT/TIG domain-containing protein [Terracidiphilus sp.]